MKKILNIPWYPIAFGAYPVLALLSVNFEQMNILVGIRPLLIFVIGALALFALLNLWVKDAHRAALLTTFSIAFFSAYGHLYHLVESHWKLSILYLPYTFLLVWFALGGLVFWLLLRKPADAKILTVPLNVASVVLLGMALYQVIYFSAVQQIPIASNSPAAQAQLSVPEGQTPPDIYYIILDSYGRADLLQDVYGYDNSKFVNSLNELGFYVAKCSHSNYPRTELSLSSSLNMDYIQNISDKFKPEDHNRVLLWKLLKNNQVKSKLEGLGYKTYAYATGFYWSELHDSDKYQGPSPFSLNPQEFEGLLVQTTLLRAAQELGWYNFDSIKADRYRERTRFILDDLAVVAKDPSPKFVFAHIISPHPPFVFGPGGQELDPDDFRDSNYNYSSAQYAKGYQLQLGFINEEIIKTVKAIQKNSATPPIIIIQGDHGPWLVPAEKGYDILNAYYLPGHQDILYQAISPVNTFRLIFDKYLGSDLPLLDDTSYRSPIPDIYNFSEIAPDRCQ